MTPFDSVMLIAFGGPEKMEDVRPFLANVLRGRPAPPERVEAVVHHYELLGGRSPLNEITFRQAAALRARLAEHGLPLPVFVGMRNWRPYFVETLREMANAGCRRALGFILAAQRSEAGWDRYQQEVLAARLEVARAPEVRFARGWHAHPLFLEAVAQLLRETLERDASGSGASPAALVFTAHSIPLRSAADSPYEAQVREGAERVARACGFTRWSVAYQSRSGNPRDPWLEPDILDVLRQLAAQGARSVVVVPIGFVCDHVEVLYDLDIEAKGLATQLGLEFRRVPTVNDHPRFIEMMADVIRTHAAEA